MKKKYLMYAGIISAAILVIMFIVILATGSFTIFPSAAIDPIPDHDTGDLVVITGTTNYPCSTQTVTGYPYGLSRSRGKNTGWRDGCFYCTGRGNGKHVVGGTGYDCHPPW